VPLETIHSAKRNRTKYVKDILKDEQLLSFEEVRANHARGHLKSATVEIWHDGHADDRESAKSNSIVKSNQTEHCMSNTTYNIDPVQPSITEYIVKSPCAPERSQGGMHTLSQGKLTIVHSFIFSSLSIFIINKELNEYGFGVCSVS
jgi:hypothetical protein